MTFGSYKGLPESPGVYLMKDSASRILYIGKAGNLRRRVSSYFERPHDLRLERLVGKIKKIDYKETDTALEALILEAELIKKFSPPFNVKEKDDKSFLYVEITKERFPRVLLVRGREARTNAERTQTNADNFPRKSASSQRKSAAKQFGPFTSASGAREALRILRRIFPWSVHPAEKIGKFSRPCIDYELGLCPGTCIGTISAAEYRKNTKNLALFFEGKKKRIIASMTKDMKVASKKLEFEKAEKLRRQIFALQHIRDTALISEPDLSSKFHILNSNYRIEGYDISNISGTSAVGSMVVFAGDRPDKNEYRKFKIRTIRQANDVGMLKEILRRRFCNDWPLSDLILVDGGKAQVNAAKIILEESGLKIPVLGIAKGPKRKKNDFVGVIPRGVDKKILIRVRNEAHRFAIAFHKKLRSKRFIE